MRDLRLGAAATLTDALGAIKEANIGRLTRRQHPQKLPLADLAGSIQVNSGGGLLMLLCSNWVRFAKMAAQVFRR
jgi:hypothetical protein